MTLANILTKASGNMAGLFQYNHNDKSHMSLYTGDCIGFDSLGFTVDGSTVSLFDTVDSTVHFTFDIASFILDKFSPKRGKGHNKATFAIGSDRYVFTFA